ELGHARHQRDGLPLRVRMLSAVDLLGRLGCLAPSLANTTLDLPLLRKLMEKTIGISARRSLPHYAQERFDRWFVKHNSANHRKSRGLVILWDDTFVRYHEPEIGIAAVKVLEALDFEGVLGHKRECCGRPAFSHGNIKEAERLGTHNLDLLGRLSDSAPILFLEPSCYSMFVEDYRELRLPHADTLAARCYLFEKFVGDLLEREPEALQFAHHPAQVAIHAHCHAKSLLHPGFMVRLAERLPGRQAVLFDTRCWGMAGAFGMLAEKYDLSLKVAAPLVEKIRERHGPNMVLVASGTSCRHQIDDLTPVHPKHMAQLLAEALGPTR